MDFEKVKEDLEKVLDDDPSNEDILCKLASAAIESRDFEQGLHILKKAVKLRPNVQTLTNLGYFYLYEGEPVDDRWVYQEARAIQVLERAVQLNPICHFTFSVLGEAYLRTHQNSKAVDVLNKAVEVEKTSINLNNLGVALFRTGNYSEAAPRFYESHQLSNQDTYSYYPYFNYAITLARLGKKEDAEAIASYIADNKDLDSINGVCHIDVISLYYETQNYRKCIEFFEVANESFSMGPAELGIYLFSLFQTGQGTKAREVLKQTIEETQQEIQNIEQDDEIEEDNKAWQRQARLKTIQEYKELYRQTEKGIRPSSAYEPIIETQCYMFGCLHHGNSMYSDFVARLGGQGDIL